MSALHSHFYSLQSQIILKKKIYKSMGNQTSANRRSIHIQLKRQRVNQPQPLHEEGDGEEDEQYQNEAQFNNDVKGVIITKQQALSFPYNCVGVLYFNDGQSRGHGTGILIAPNLVITSAHNLCSFHHRQRKEFTNLIFYPGLSGSVRKNRLKREDISESDELRGIRVESIKISQQFKSRDKIKYDYALLKLEERVEREQYFSLGVGYHYAKQVITNIGYREGDVRYDQPLAIQKMERREEADHTVENSFKLHHKITTTKGSSGSPILVDREGNQIVIAIHKGVLTAAKGKTKKVNSARIISEDMYDTILKWEKQFYLQDFTSKIKAYQIDASPQLQQQMERGKEIFFGEKFTKQLWDKVQKTFTEWQKQCIFYCNSLRTNIQAVVKKIQKLDEQKISLEMLLKAQKINHDMLLQQINILSRQFNSLSVANSIMKSQWSIGQLKSHKMVSKQSKDSIRTSAQSTPWKERNSSPNKSKKYSRNHSISAHKLTKDQFLDRQTPYTDKFTVNKRRVTLNQEDCSRSYYQITGLHPLSKRSVVYFKLHKYGGRSDICFGILTADRKQDQYSGDSGVSHKGSVGYWTSLRDGTGMVKVDGLEENQWSQQHYMAEGSTLVMETDLEEMKIDFFIQSQEKRYEYKLSDHFKDKLVYTFVALATVGDTVEIIQ